MSHDLRYRCALRPFFGWGRGRNTERRKPALISRLQSKGCDDRKTTAGAQNAARKNGVAGDAEGNDVLHLSRPVAQRDLCWQQSAVSGLRKFDGATK